MYLHNEDSNNLWALGTGSYMNLITWSLVMWILNTFENLHGLTLSQFHLFYRYWAKILFLYDLLILWIWVSPFQKRLFSVCVTVSTNENHKSHTWIGLPVIQRPAVVSNNSIILKLHCIYKEEASLIKCNYWQNNGFCQDCLHGYVLTCLRTRIINMESGMFKTCLTTRIISLESALDEAD